jgi:hypothetical protein
LRADLSVNRQLFPDPVFSANIYCAGRLDGVIHRVLAPFWAAAKGADQGAYLWLMRYAKNGEHLKLRLHGEAGAEALMEPLGALLERYFGELPREEPEAVRKSTPSATPIDAEDQEPKDQPDRSFLPTGYKRSAIPFGYSPWVDDSVYVGLMTRAFAAGTESIFEKLKTGEDGRAPHSLVQGLLIQAVLDGLAAFGLAAGQRGDYLAYHRDWLLRAALKNTAASAVGPEKVAELIARFDRQVAALGDAALARIGEAARRRFAEPEAASFNPWQLALAELRAYVEQAAGEPRRHIDPFAEDRRFPPFFKAFHVFANQLGLNPLNEAFAHHLLLRAAVDGLDAPQRQVVLRPRFRSAAV